MPRGRCSPSLEKATTCILSTILHTTRRYSRVRRWNSTGSTTALDRFSSKVLTVFLGVDGRSRAPRPAQSVEGGELTRTPVLIFDGEESRLQADGEHEGQYKLIFRSGIGDHR